MSLELLLPNFPAERSPSARTSAIIPRRPVLWRTSPEFSSTLTFKKPPWRIQQVYIHQSRWNESFFPKVLKAKLATPPFSVICGFQRTNHGVRWKSQHTSFDKLTSHQGALLLLLLLPFPACWGSPASVLLPKGRSPLRMYICVTNLRLFPLFYLIPRVAFVYCILVKWSETRGTSVKQSELLV